MANDPYGLLASGLPPEIAAEAMGLHGKEAIMQALLQQGMQPIQEQQVKGRFSVPISPLQGIAKLVQAYVGAKGLQDTQQGYGTLGGKYQQGVADAMTKYQQQKMGTTAPTPLDPQEIQQSADQGTPLPTPGPQQIPGNPRAAIAQALVNPYLAKNPMIAHDLKQIDPAMKMVDTGGQITPVNPYTQKDPLPKTVDPNKVGDPASIELNAQAIAKGQLAPLSSFALKTPQGASIMARVMQINPQYDAKDWTTQTKAEKDFATGKQGNTARSFNVAIAHLGTLDRLADALNNNDTQLINKIGNEFATQSGGPAPTNFVAAKKIVGDEIVKAIVGSGGGVTDREEAAKTMSAVSSPAQLKGVINTYKELMGGQLKGLETQYEASTKKKDFREKFLSPEARNALNKPSSGPAVGLVQDGYRFKGGNPADKNSWEKI